MNLDVSSSKKEETDTGEGAKAKNCSGRFENANPLLLVSGELNTDPISCEKRGKLPMDGEAEMLSSVATKIKSFFTVCNLEMDQKEWANESGWKEIQALLDVTNPYKFEYLTKELRSKVTEKFIELNCINIFNDFFLFSLRKSSTIYEKNDEYFTDEIKKLEEQNTNNSLDEEISNFNVLLYTQRILSSMMAIAVNCTNSSFTFCRICVEGEFISTIIRLLEIYLPIRDDEEIKVCFYNEPLFAMI